MGKHRVEKSSDFSHLIERFCSHTSKKRRKTNKMTQNKITKQEKTYIRNKEVYVLIENAIREWVPGVLGARYFESGKREIRHEDTKNMIRKSNNLMRILRKLT